MTQDVEAGADIFFFAQDQLARLVKAGAVAQLGKAATATVKENNATATITAASTGDSVYAYPLTNDNGYYLYYDKSVLSADDVKDLSTMISKLEAANKFFAFELEGSAWYTASFFFATGCETVFKTDDDGNFVDFVDTFNSANGVIAAKAMNIVLQSSAYLNSSQASEFANGAAAVVSGTWDAKTAQELLGANYATAELPSFTMDGQTYHLGSFSGCKLLGVKPQKDAVKSAALNQLALYLTGEKCQLERFEALEWGPSNNAAAANDKVKANAALTALAQQNQYGKVQGQIDGAWWDIGKALATGIKDGKDAGIQAALDNYVEKLKAIYTMSDEAKNAFTVIGALCDTNWNYDFEMTSDGNGVWKSAVLELKAGNEFQCRQGLSWDVQFGAIGDDGFSTKSNFVVEADGKYVIQLTFDKAAGTGKVELIAQ